MKVITYFLFEKKPFFKKVIVSIAVDIFLGNKNSLPLKNNHIINRKVQLKVVVYSD